MITQIRRILKDLPRFLHKHLGLGTTLTLSLMGVAVILSPVFIEKAKQASVPDFLNAAAEADIISIKDASLVSQSSPMDEIGGNHNDDFAGSMVVEKGSVVDSPATTGNAYNINGSLIYKVAKGDLVSTLARKFDVPASAIISANNLKKSGFIRLGQELVIPNTKASTAKKIASDSELPDVKGYLSMPVKDGLNLGKLHGNAVDILAACDTPIYASADGIVENVVDPSEWNNGNGGYIAIKHQLNDIETTYAHNSKNFVEVGDLVRQGDKIAEVGNTGGGAEEPTSCNVQFGVIGAKHPFVK